LDELLLAGELQETSKKAVARFIEAQDQLVEQVKAGNVTETEFASFSGPRG
jgi:AP-1 complex subunit sigma 1/2